jgi:hypothetical protein
MGFIFCFAGVNDRIWRAAHGHRRVRRVPKWPAEAGKLPAAGRGKGRSHVCVTAFRDDGGLDGPDPGCWPVSAPAVIDVFQYREFGPGNDFSRERWAGRR